MSNTKTVKQTKKTKAKTTTKAKAKTKSKAKTKTKSSKESSGKLDLNKFKNSKSGLGSLLYIVGNLGTGHKKAAAV